MAQQINVKKKKSGGGLRKRLNTILTQVYKNLQGGRRSDGIRHLKDLHRELGVREEEWCENSTAKTRNQSQGRRKEEKKKEVVLVRTTDRSSHLATTLAETPADVLVESTDGLPQIASVSVCASSTVSAGFEKETSHLAIEAHEYQESVDSTKPEVLEQQPKEQLARSKDPLWSSEGRDNFEVISISPDLATIEAKEAKLLGVTSGNDAWWLEDDLQTPEAELQAIYGLPSHEEAMDLGDFEFEQALLEDNPPGSPNKQFQHLEKEDEENPRSCSVDAVIYM